MFCNYFSQMKRGNSASEVEILDILIAARSHQGREPFLIRKSIYRGGEVSISADRARDRAADDRQNALEIEFEELTKKGNYRL